MNPCGKNEIEVIESRKREARKRGNMREEKGGRGVDTWMGGWMDGWMDHSQVFLPQSMMFWVPDPDDTLPIKFI